MKSSSKPIQEDDSSCEETVVPSQQCEVRQHEETEENSPSKVVEEKIQRINTERYEEQEILLNQQKHIQVISINTICENGCFLYLLFSVQQLQVIQSLSFV